MLRGFQFDRHSFVLCFTFLPFFSTRDKSKQNKYNAAAIDFFRKETAGVLLFLNRQQVPQLEDS